MDALPWKHGDQFEVIGNEDGMWHSFEIGDVVTLVETEDDGSQVFIRDIDGRIQYVLAKDLRKL